LEFKQPSRKVKAKIQLFIEMESFYDVSGSCHLMRNKYYNKYHRPNLTLEIARHMGIDYKKWKGSSVIRALYFEKHKQEDRRYTLISTCGNQNCINLEHNVIGLFNPKSREPAPMPLPLQG